MTTENPVPGYRVDHGYIATIRKGELWIHGNKIGEFEHIIPDAFTAIEEWADARGMRVFRRGMLTFYIVGPASMYWSRASSRIPLSS